MDEPSGPSTVSPERLANLCRVLRLQFRDPALLQTALIHSSHSHEAGSVSNERLEFLGDAAVGFIVGEWLFQRYPDLPEGELTWMRSAVVSRRALAGVGRRLGLQEYLVLGRGEESKREGLSDGVIGGAVEAIIGARLVDAGYGRTRRFVLRLLREELEKVEPGVSVRDAKSRLQHEMQSRFRVTPRYQVERLEPEEPLRHVAEVYLRDRLLGRGEGRKRRDAEQAAAEEALAELSRDEPGVSP